MSAPRFNTVPWELQAKAEAVLHRIASGQGTKEIASEMNLSAKTVEYYRAEIYKAVPECKQNQALLIVLAVKRGYGIRECGWCQASLSPDSPYWRQYCNHRCRQNAWRDSHQERHAANQRRDYERHKAARQAYGRNYYHEHGKAKRSGRLDTVSRLKSALQN